MTNDTISDVITRLRNASMLGVQTTTLPKTKSSQQILQILKQEGFIHDYKPLSVGSTKTLTGYQRSQPRPQPQFHVTFQPPRSSKPILTNLKRISRPGRRVYARQGEIPRVFGGLGIIILSTSCGMLTDKQAYQKGVGGEVVCSVW
uniref:Small ribosomal subunit protein uS8c n=1 Tax=Pseudobryopsis hainanensis TaxID=2320808 RepID=A0A3S7SYE4_9CHLO|nr:ribosomal protein S8 [Pseudobryopsis hainanensis]